MHRQLALICRLTVLLSALVPPPPACPRQPETGTGLLVAATNPLLLTTCKHWPHILRLDRFVAPSALSPSAASPPPPPSSGGFAPTNSSSSSSRDATALSPSSTVPTIASPAATGLFRSHHPPQRSASTGSRFATATAVAADSKSVLPGQKLGVSNQVNPAYNKSFGLKSTRRRHVKKDEAVRKEIESLWLSGNCQYRLPLLVFGPVLSLEPRWQMLTRSRKRGARGVPSCCLFS